MDPNLRLSLTVVAIVMALAIYGRWFRRINSWIVAIGKWLFRIALDEKTCKVAETFFIEAAVLWFVFPTLDIIYEHRNIGDPVLRQAYVACIFCFLAAVALSHMGEGE